MKIYKKIGSKDRLFEMFENVNKIKINEENYNFSIDAGDGKKIEEDINNEVGTDSGIFQMLFAYVTKNPITDEEFQVGELTVQILANPTTWDESPYMAATHMQPEEGGYPENVQGEISDIVIWDREDNEYTLSSDALQKLNQKVQFDGNVLEDITEKAANGGSEDEYSRADYARKDSLENEGFIKEDDVNNITRKYIDNIEGLSPERKAELISRQTAPQDNASPSNLEYKRMITSNGLRGEEPKNRKDRRSAGLGGDFSKNIRGKLKESQSMEELHQEIYDELDMRYSPTSRTIPFDEIIDVANMYDTYSPADVTQIANDVINANAAMGDEDFNNNLNDFIKNLQDLNVDYQNKPTVSMWEEFENQYNEGSGFEEFREKWDKLTKDPAQTNMFETSYYDLTKKTGTDMMEGIRFNYDQKGNWIPEGYEDKRVALRPLEQPLGSDNWKVALVTLDANGELDDIVKVTDTWEEGKNALYDSVN